MKRSKSKKTEKNSVEHRFPSPAARTAADLAIVDLDPTLPMTVFIDSWFIAYVKAGGRVDGTAH